MKIMRKIALVTAAVTLLPGAAHALWYGSKSAHETLDDCLKHYSKCYWGGTLVEKDGRTAPLVAQPATRIPALEEANATRPPPGGRPLPTDGDILLYTTKRPPPTDPDAGKYTHMCLFGASVKPAPCGKSAKDIWIKS